MTTILNLPGLNVLRVEDAEHDYHVYAETPGDAAACPHCRSDAVVGFGRHERLIRDLPSHGKRVGIYLNGRRYRCRGCNKTFFERLPVVDDSRDMTRRLVEWIGKQSVKRPFAHIADETGVVEGTVRAIFAAYVEELGNTTRFETPEWLGIDEIHLLKRPRAVIGNVRENTIIEMLPDRAKTSILSYFTRMPDRQRVEIVTMDMWTPYRDAARTVLPRATVVVDKFHVVRMANAALEAVRKAQRAALTPQARRGLMHDRFVLLKRASALTDKDVLMLTGWTNNHPALKEAYDAKEAFFGLYDCTTRAEAERYYGAWENTVMGDDVAWAYKDLMTAMRNWRPEILNYFDHRVTNAFIESMNNLIRLMNRIGRGYSFEALRAKVLYTDKLHKVQRPKFQRRSRGDDEIGYGVPDGAMGRWTPPTAAASRNLGTDVATLIALLESDSL